MGKRGQALLVAEIARTKAQSRAGTQGMERWREIQGQVTEGLGWRAAEFGFILWAVGSQGRVVSAGEPGPGGDHSRAVLCPGLGERERNSRHVGLAELGDQLHGVGAEVGLGGTPEGGSMWPPSPAARCWMEPRAGGSSLGRMGRAAVLVAERPDGKERAESGRRGLALGATDVGRDRGLEGGRDLRPDGLWAGRRDRQPEEDGSAVLLQEPVGSPHQVREQKAWPHALPSQCNGFILHKYSQRFCGVATIASFCNHLGFRGYSLRFREVK